LSCAVFFFLMVPPLTVLYSLSLHDALPICVDCAVGRLHQKIGRAAICQRVAEFEPNFGPRQDFINKERSGVGIQVSGNVPGLALDRKSTRLNSSHVAISYAVFCLKKKKNKS